MLTQVPANETFRVVKQDQSLPESAKQTKELIEIVKIFRATCNSICNERKASVDRREMAIQELRRVDQRLVALERNLERIKNERKEAVAA